MTITDRESIISLVMRYRRVAVVIIHIILIVLANYCAFLLRFDGAISKSDWRLFTQMLPWLVAIRMIIFIPFRLYQGLWRYTGLQDLASIFGAVCVSSAIFFTLVTWGISVSAYPRSIYVIDSLVLVFLMGGVRLVRRVYRSPYGPQAERKVLIFGAGDAGEMIVRDMINNPFYRVEPVGFIDDDLRKVGRRIHNVRVLGTRADLPRIIERTRPDEVLVAMPRAELSVIRGVLKSLEGFNVAIKTLPNLRDVLDGKVTFSQIRNLSLEDLLERPPVGLDPEPLRRLISGRRVMVTGAGGSIGSELCRQILAFEPAALILFERYENSLYAIANDLAARRGGDVAVPVVGDVTDHHRINRVMALHSPELVLHAAAHKHVPLMEQSPCEAIKNNVFGTLNVAEAAARHGVSRFILISTDKAVKPSSVMGASKRVAERAVLTLVDQSSTSFVVVRFGNVLGSNGSVVPRFLDQIKAGGPVTVTHPEMRRFFMLIPEAVQLVLHAAAIGHGGVTCVLEMGEQIRIVDMARTLIRLAGFIPEREIPIEFVGLRPGEKLYEELTGEDEIVESSATDKIMLVRPRMTPDRDLLKAQLSELEALAARGDEHTVLMTLRDLVPDFKPGICVPTEAGPILEPIVGAASPSTRPLRSPIQMPLEAPLSPRLQKA
jgi:FlaA1/EpsC-like NDP-sugar epimerase